MSLSGIKTALKDAGLKYDFIGFDTCLMATTETALMLSEFADYMIGSEETEPGIGWFRPMTKTTKLKRFFLSTGFWGASVFGLFSSGLSLVSSLFISLF